MSEAVRRVETEAEIRYLNQCLAGMPSVEGAGEG